MDELVGWSKETTGGVDEVFGEAILLLYLQRGYVLLPTNTDFAQALAASDHTKIHRDHMDPGCLAGTEVQNMSRKQSSVRNKGSPSTERSVMYCKNKRIDVSLPADMVVN